MKSSCCYADTIKGGVLNGEQVLICTKCKKAVVEKSTEKLERDVASLKNTYADVLKKNVLLKVENKELKKYITKLEKFINEKRTS